MKKKAKVRLTKPEAQTLGHLKGKARKAAERQLRSTWEQTVPVERRGHA